MQGFAQDCEQDVLDLGALGLRSRVQQVFCDFEVEGAEVGVDEGVYFADAFVEAVGVVGGESWDIPKRCSRNRTCSRAIGSYRRLGQCLVGCPSQTRKRL